MILFRIKITRAEPVSEDEDKQLTLEQTFILVLEMSINLIRVISQKLKSLFREEVFIDFYAKGININF